MLFSRLRESVAFLICPELRDQIEVTAAMWAADRPGYSGTTKPLERAERDRREEKWFFEVEKAYAHQEACRERLEAASVRFDRICKLGGGELALRRAVDAAGHMLIARQELARAVNRYTATRDAEIIRVQRACAG